MKYCDFAVRCVTTRDGGRAFYRRVEHILDALSNYGNFDIIRGYFIQCFPNLFRNRAS